MLKLTRIYILTLRPWFWWAAIAPGVAGYLWAAQTMTFPDLFWIVFILGFGLSGFAEMCNELYDGEYDVTQRQFSAFGINSSGGLGLAARNCSLLRYKNRFLLLHIMFVIICAMIWTEIPVMLITIGALIGWTYSAKPFRLKANVITNIGSKVVGYGVVSFFIGVALAGGAFSWHALLLGAAIGLIECGYNGIADINDLEADKENGILTLPVAIGPTLAAIIYMLFCIVGLGALLANRIATPTTSTSSISIIVTLIVVIACSSLTLAVLKYASQNAKSRLSQLHLLSGITMMSSVIWLIS
jgi:4-hydroxybenzoate polyprenyltransferase